MNGIVAVYADWGIGSGGTQPIVIPEDRKRFASLTKGAAVIVGRRTLEDFPGGKPLKGRRNIVLTRSQLEVEGAQVVHTAREALESVEGLDNVFVIGGATVYMEMFPHLNRVYVTKINVTPHSDAYFPNLDKHPDWRLTDGGETMRSGELEYRYCVYERG